MTEMRSLQHALMMFRIMKNNGIGIFKKGIRKEDIPLAGYFFGARAGQCSVVLIEMLETAFFYMHCQPI